MKTMFYSAADMHRGAVILVNRSYPLREQKPPALCPADERYPDILLARHAARLLGECIAACRGAREIVPVSGWRSQAEQQRIWDGAMAESGEAFTRQYVALPGCSEHQTGLAIDLGRASEHIDFIRPDFSTDGVCGAFRRLAARYGFIERYPRGREAVTGIAHEPWHFRYVGAPHALLLTENGLCLEEYPDFLRAGPRTVTLDRGRRVTVSYVPCSGAETAIDVPDGCFQVSGDNAGGFIVTVWGCAA